MSQTLVPAAPDEPSPNRDLERTVSLIRRANEGSQTAWAALYDKCIGPIMGLVRAHTGPHILIRESTEDLAQGVLEEMVKGLKHLEYRSTGEFMAWISKLVRSKIAERANYYKAKKRPPPGQRIGNGSSDGGVQECMLPGNKTTPDVGAQRRDEYHFLLRCSRHLSAAERRVLDLFLDHGNDMKALGEALGTSPDAARMRWNRIRSKLRRIARNEGEGEAA